MELDNLKEVWKKQETSVFNIKSKDIMELIQNQRYGSVASLKQRVKKQLLIITLFIGTIIFDFTKRPSLTKEPLMWMSIIIMFLCSIYILFNYYILSKIDNPVGNIKTSLIQNITSLERGVKVYNWAAMLLLMFLFISVEYYPGLKEFFGFFKIPVMLRIICYIVMLIFFFFLRKYVNYRHFGRHIDFLKDLLNKME